MVRQGDVAVVVVVVVVVVDLVLPSWGFDLDWEVGAHCCRRRLGFREAWRRLHEIAEWL